MEISALARDVYAMLVRKGQLPGADISSDREDLELVQHVLDYVEVIAGVDFSDYEPDDDSWSDDLFEDDDDDDSAS